jgi:hypothetical protein
MPSPIAKRILDHAAGQLPRRRAAGPRDSKEECRTCGFSSHKRIPKHSIRLAAPEGGSFAHCTLRKDSPQSTPSNGLEWPTRWRPITQNAADSTKKLRTTGSSRTKRWRLCTIPEKRLDSVLHHLESLMSTMGNDARWMTPQHFDPAPSDSTSDSSPYQTVGRHGDHGDRTRATRFTAAAFDRPGRRPRRAAASFLRIDHQGKTDPILSLRRKPFGGFSLNSLEWRAPLGPWRN